MTNEQIFAALILPALLAAGGWVFALLLPRWLDRMERAERRR